MIIISCKENLRVTRLYKMKGGAARRQEALPLNNQRPRVAPPFFLYTLKENFLLRSIDALNSFWLDPLSLSSLNDLKSIN